MMNLLTNFCVVLARVALSCSLETSAEARDILIATINLSGSRYG
jgi:hypothetical protein